MKKKCYKIFVLMLFVIVLSPVIYGLKNVGSTEQGNLRITGWDEDCFTSICKISFNVTNSHKSQNRSWIPSFDGDFEVTNMYYKESHLIYHERKISGVNNVTYFNTSTGFNSTKLNYSYYFREVNRTEWVLIKNLRNENSQKYKKKYFVDSLIFKPKETKEFFVILKNEFNVKPRKYDIGHHDPLINNTVYSAGGVGQSFLNDMNRLGTTANITAGLLIRQNITGIPQSNFYQGFLNNASAIWQLEPNQNKRDSRNGLHNISGFNNTGYKNATGKIGGGMNFNKSTGFRSSDSAVDKVASTKDGSVSFWLNANNAGATGAAVGKSATGGGSSRRWFFYIDPDNLANSQVALFNCNGWSTYATAHKTGWTMWTVTWKASTGNMSLYRNDSFILSDLGTCSGTDTSPLGIGAYAYPYPDGNRDLNGTYDEIVVFNTTLNIANITRIYNSGNGINMTKVVNSTTKNINASFKSKELNSTRFLRKIVTTSNWTGLRRGINYTCNGWGGTWTTRTNDSQITCPIVGKSFSYQGNLSTQSNLSELNVTFILNHNATITFVSPANASVVDENYARLNITLIDYDGDKTNVTFYASTSLTNVSISVVNQTKNWVNNTNKIKNFSSNQLRNGTRLYWKVSAKDSYNGSVNSSVRNVLFNPLTVHKVTEFLQYNRSVNISRNGTYYVKMRYDFGSLNNGTLGANWTIRKKLLNSSINQTVYSLNNNSQFTLFNLSSDGQFNFTLNQNMGSCRAYNASFLIPFNMTPFRSSCTGISSGTCNVTFNLSSRHSNLQIQGIRVFINASELNSWDVRRSVDVSYVNLSGQSRNIQTGSLSAITCLNIGSSNTGTDTNFSASLSGNDVTISGVRLIGSGKGLEIIGLKLGGQNNMFSVFYNWGDVELGGGDAGGGAGGGGAGGGVSIVTEIVKVGNFTVMPSNVDLWFLKFPYFKKSAEFVFFANEDVESCVVIGDRNSSFSCVVDSFGRVKLVFVSEDNVFSDKVDVKMRVLSKNDNQVFIPVTYRVANFGWFYETEDLKTEIPLLTVNEGGVVKGVYILSGVLLVFGLLFLFKVF